MTEIDLKPIRQISPSPGRDTAATKPGALSIKWTNKTSRDLLAHSVLILGAALMTFPIYMAFVASSHTLTQTLTGLPLLPGDRLIDNYRQVLSEGLRNYGLPPIWPMLVNSIVVALVITFGKIAVSILSAFAVVFFRFPFRMLAFWIIFATLMLPVEVRILPTFKVVSDLHMLDTYAGLTVPLIASATATFLFRQFFLTIPDELAEAARIDGAGPMRFFWDVVVPLSRPSIAALFLILFIFGWNQYLWPLLVTTDESMYTTVIGIKRMIAGGEAATEWNLVMATAMLAMLPPALLVLLTQKWFVKGLVDTEK